MRIRFLQNTAAANLHSYMKDGIYDLSDMEARGFIKSGLAVVEGAAVFDKQTSIKPKRKSKEL